MPGQTTSDGTSVTVVVPPIFDISSLMTLAGPATVVAQELLSKQEMPISKAAKLTIQPLPQYQAQAGTVTSAFVAAEETFAMNLNTQVSNTTLSTMQGTLTQEAAALGALKNQLGVGSNPGSIEGTTVTVEQSDLMMADQQVLQMLSSIAGLPGSAGGGGSKSATTASGCLAAEAAQALKDVNNPNPTVFNADIVQFFTDSITSTVCKLPNPAIATASVVNGASGVALAFTSQASNPALAQLIPAEALVLADLVRRRN